MAYTITLSATFVDLATANRCLDSYCLLNGYDPTSGLTKLQFFKKKQIETPLRESTRQVERQAAIQTQLNTFNSSVDSISIT